MALCSVISLAEEGGSDAQPRRLPIRVSLLGQIPNVVVVDSVPAAVRYDGRLATSLSHSLLLFKGGGQEQKKNQSSVITAKFDWPLPDSFQFTVSGRDNLFRVSFGRLF